jgi:serine/threonine-protein kinase RsbW
MLRQAVEVHHMAQLQTLNDRLDSRPWLAGRRAGSSLLEIEGWIPSDMKSVRSLVHQLSRLIEGSRCVVGDESAVELALLEAVTNAVVHGNRLDPRRLVQVLCRCELSRGVSVVVKDQGQGFDPDAVANPPAVENRNAKRGRGIHLMKQTMDEVKFENNGTAVRMWKGAGRWQRACIRTGNQKVSTEGCRHHVAAVTET